ncbi:Histidine kinase-, DNA gyrase B-, and HSP90-like ATPase [Filimonas lacunae]|uniref:histidine kinase n=1 Tax=Filimonas lacunae TaxID=477680 RepID=A0A173MFM7_9BACT|nr:ATP-binding protein [Filimonas lacunae]BAV06289.1 two-component sensor histidine kinase [Filimonas lacunae]SIT25677.1 Histidine kinase-, DNA gyrase B-, and HSP90-like ATPase [Filimonas lacunae]
MSTVTVQWLQSIEALQDVPAVQLQWLIDNSDILELAAGDFLVKQGVAHKGTNIILEGRVRLYNQQVNQVTELAILEANTISGYLPYSRGKIANLNGLAITPVRYLCFPVGNIQELSRHFELTEALVHVMTSRVRDFTSFLRQNEKMVALGKLSAGLAHELNNPAAAVVRGASSLKKHLQLLPSGFEEIASMCMQPAEVALVKEKLLAILQQTPSAPLSLLQKSSREDELTDWLDAHNIHNSMALAECFADFDFTVQSLDALASDIPEHYRSAIFNWLHKNLVTEKLVADIEEASRRIAQLVGSVKTFTHMDQGTARQFTNLHEGIDNTLVILGYKLRQGNVQLIKNFDAQLPLIPVVVSEVNQVWTNLIDNALDAMEANGKGVLEITTGLEEGYAKVTITDNGPGIPADVMDRLFEPFFTTKDIGKGTGLGLDIVNNIVKQHKGLVKVTSVPQHTTFTVLLPVII